MTLLEVIISLGILVTVLLAVAGVLRSAQVSTSTTTEHQAASHEAFRRLDLVLGTPFASCELLWNETTFEVTSPITGAALPPAAGSSSTGAVQVHADPDSNGSTDLLEARVTVTWRDVLGDERSLEAIGRLAR